MGTQALWGSSAAWFGLFGIGILWAGVFLLLTTEREGELAGAAKETSNLARAFEEHMYRSIKTVDQTLLYVRDIYGQNPSNFDVSNWSRNTRALGDLTFQISVIDRDGWLTFSNFAAPGTRLDLSDREHFRVHRDRPSDELDISKPVLGRASKKWSIQITRRLSAADGSFNGVIVASVDPEYLSRFYSSIDLGKDGLVILAKRDGIIVAGAQAGTTDEAARASQSGIYLIGKSLSGGLLTDAFTSQQSGVVTGTIDDVRRIYAYRSLQSYPLVVTVGVGEDEVLTDYSTHRRLDFLVAGLLTIVLLSVTALVIIRQIRLSRVRGQLQTSAHLLHLTLAHMSQGILMVDGDGKVPVINRQAIQELNLPESFMSGRRLFKDLVGFQVRRGDFGVDGANLPEDVRATVLSAKPVTERQTYERLHPNGTVFEIISVPLDTGGMVRTFTNVTVARERERALESALARRDEAETALRQHRDNLEIEVAVRTCALAASEARHRDFAEVSSDWLWETDAHTNLTYVSDPFAAGCGVPSWKVVGGTFGSLSAFGVEQDGLDEIQAVLDRGVTFQSVVFRLVLPHLGIRFWRISGKPFVDLETGLHAGFRGTGTDVTIEIERDAALKTTLLRAETAELEARQTRARLVDAIEAVPEGFVLYDAEDQMVLCNRHYRDIFKLPADFAVPGVRYADVLRRIVGAGDIVLPDQEAGEWLDEQLAVRALGGATSREYRMACGRLLQVDDWPTSDGGRVGIRTDVTDARRRDLIERDREKLAALGQLAGGVAHEINNLIQPAISLPEFIRDLLPEDAADARGDLDCIVESGIQVREIVRNILLFARKEDPRLEQLDLIAELTSALSFIKHLIPAGVMLSARQFEAHAGCRLAANKTQLTQVLTNILVNAAHACDGNGTVTVEVARVRPSPGLAAELALEAAGHYLVISIADTGCGMDKATQLRIFEPFFSTKPIGQGTGLGLSVVFGILRSWNGAISVSSTVGQGTIFSLYVPELGPSASGH